MKEVNAITVNKRVSQASSEEPSQVPLIVIQPSHGWTSLRLRELWEYRELLYFLVWRDIKVRYKQTILGVAWVILQPLLTSIVFSVIFGDFAQIPSENLPYVVFAMAGLVPWNFFSGAFSRGAVSLVSSANLISKVYFPRLIIPISGVLTGTLDMLIALGVLFCLMFYYNIMPTFTFLFLPFFLLLTVVTALGMSLWLSALNVKYRDIGFLLPFLTQFWFYATPVIYPTSLVPDRWRIVYGLNPLVGLIEGFRWALFRTGDSPTVILLISVGMIFILLVTGTVFFLRMEKSFADVV